jgi:hypothetical protein
MKTLYKILKLKVSKIDERKIKTRKYNYNIKKHTKQKIYNYINIT